MVSEQVKFKILGTEWRLRVYAKNKDYKKKNGKGSVAITRFHNRKIDLSPKGYDKETVIHELVHAYLYEMCSGSCSLSDKNLEELFCELLAKRGHEILKLGEELCERIQKITHTYDRKDTQQNYYSRLHVRDT